MMSIARHSAHERRRTKRRFVEARAAIGDTATLLPLMSASLLLLGGVMAIFSARFADTAITASTYAVARAPGAKTRAFRRGSRQQALRRKEFILLGRDPLHGVPVPGLHRAVENADLIASGKDVGEHQDLLVGHTHGNLVG